MAKSAHSVVTAAAATVLGWFLMFALVIGATAILMLILNVLM